MHRFLARGLALVLFAALVTAPAAFAQDAPPPAPQPEVAATDFDETEITAFAEAYLDIEDLQLQYQQEHGQIEDPAAMEQVQQQFQADAEQVIDDAGLTVERYEAILIAAQTNPEFAEEVIERLEQLRAERTG